MVGVADARGDLVRDAAALLVDRLGRPDVGVVLGSGFAPLAVGLGADDPEPWPDGLGVPTPAREDARRGIAAGRFHGRPAWVVLGRIHGYEGVDARSAALPVELLAAAGARDVLVTCAAGGLSPSDRPGDLAVVRDHLNLTGDDPVRRIDPGARDPEYPDLADAYDPAWSDRIAGAARAAGARIREGVLAAVVGPSYETPAEVRMLRALGADLASMSVVPEVVLARYFGLRTAALACVANRGAGMGGPIRHDAVVDTVSSAVQGLAGWLPGPGPDAGS